MKQASTKEGRYIYCIIEIGEPRPCTQERGESKTFGHLGIGGRNDLLYTVCFDNLAAVVSDSPLMKYSISRENTIAHEKAIEEVMKEYTVLPARFGTIAEDEEKVKQILEKESGNFKTLLAKMEGKKELGLKAVFKENIYNDILVKYEDIRILKEKLANLPPEKTIYQRVEIGRMVQEALEKEKERYKSQILDVLSPLVEELKINNNYGERMFLSAAFLINKDKEELFDQKVQEFDAKYGEKVNFKYVGTVPPFNFVNLVIDTSTLLNVNGERSRTIETGGNRVSN